MRIQVLEAILEENMFDALRNKQQLGYYVSASQRYIRGVSGLLFTIESSVYTPIELQDKIMDFIKEFYETKLNEAMYLNFLNSVIIRKQQPNKDI